MVIKKISDIRPSYSQAQAEKSKTAKAGEMPIRGKLPAKTVFLSKKFVPLYTGAFLILATTLSYFFIPPRLSIEIWPTKVDVEDGVTVTVSPNFEGENSIVGEILQAEKTFSQNFSVEGVTLKEVKAAGAIRIYNSYSTAPQPLLASTRFVSSGGELFRIAKAVVVPGGRYEGGKLVAGTVDAEVIADQPGPEYNIGPTTFSIPGFAGTSKYTFFYAKSSEPMTGGMKKQVSLVTQKELDKAKEILSQKALSGVGDVIRESLPSKDYVILDQTFSSQITDFQPSVKEGGEASSFSAQIKLLARVLVFKNSALENFALNRLKDVINPEVKLIESSLTIGYSPEIIKGEKDKVALKLKLGGQAHSLPDNDKIKEIVKGKTEQGVGEIIRGLGDAVERAKIKFWPFWVSLAPEDPKSIDIILHF